jgi:purine operon repressor
MKGMDINMERSQRNERLTVLMKILSDSPSKVITFNTFTEMFGSAKSTISEDVEILRNIVEKFQLGSLETIPGASGGVRFIPSLSKSKTRQVTENLCGELSKGERILPGGYLYMLDVIYNPVMISDIGRIFCNQFFQMGINYVVTVETKGIPLALITAEHMNVPLIIVNHYNEATDGASVNINYVSGSTNRIQTMVLSRKAVKKNSRLLFIDDFMKGGGTAKGIIELAKEFECEVVGIGVLIETAEPKRKLIENCFSLLTLERVNYEEGIIEIVSSNERKNLD